MDNTLNHVISFLAKKRGYQSLTELGKAMGQTPTNIFNNLKYFGKARNYHSSFARKLYTTLGITEEDFKMEVAQAESKVPPKGTSSIVKVADRKAAYLSDTCMTSFMDILSIMDALEPEDTFVQTFSRGPWEFNDQLYQSAVVKGMDRGVKFGYVVFDPPTEPSEFGIEFLSGSPLKATFSAWKMVLEEEALNYGLHVKLDNFLYITTLKNSFLNSPINNFIIIRKNSTHEVFVFVESCINRVYSTGSRDMVSFYYPLPKTVANIIGKIEGIFPSRVSPQISVSKHENEKELEPVMAKK